MGILSPDQVNGAGTKPKHKLARRIVGIFLGTVILISIVGLIGCEAGFWTSVNTPAHARIDSNSPEPCSRSMRFISEDCYSYESL